jgi:8-oxo-dGTP diphosphatase
MSTADYNSRVVEALKAAMRMRGMEGNKSAFARLLRGRVGDGPAPNTVGRWLRGEQTIPAWALVAAAEAVQIDLGELLGLEGQTVPEELRALREELETQRRAAEGVERRIDEAVESRIEQLMVQVLNRLQRGATLEASLPSAAATPTQELNPLAAAIIVRDDRVLLTERRYPGHGEQWSWPSGKIERGESLEDAILRELHEELLITEAQIVRFVGDIDLPSGYRMSHFHVAIPPDVEPKLNDYEQLVRTEWMTRDQAADAFSSLPPDVARLGLDYLDQVFADVQVEAMDKASAQPATEEEAERTRQRRSRSA